MHISLCFAGVGSVDVFIFFWDWEIFDRMEGVLGFMSSRYAQNVILQGMGFSEL